MKINDGETKSAIMRNETKRKSRSIALKRTERKRGKEKEISRINEPNDKK